MFFMPGSSHRGPLPPLTDSEHAIATNLARHVQVLAGEIGARSLTAAPENLYRAAKYISESFVSLGYEPVEQVLDAMFGARDLQSGKFNHSSPSVKLSTSNVIAELKGSFQPDQIVVLGAHYDSVYNCPAANDNGSGVAAMLELARLLSPMKPAKTIRFVAFTNEEPPFFGTSSMGSRRYAELCRERSDNIIGMMSLETMGYYSDLPNTQQFPLKALGLMFPTTGNFVAFVSNIKSYRFLSNCIGAFRRDTKFPSEAAPLPEALSGVGFSDHQSFWKVGYPAIMITDTAPYRYPQYHTMDDTPDKINYEHLARVVQGLARVVAQL